MSAETGVALDTNSAPAAPVTVEIRRRLGGGAFESVDGTGSETVGRSCSSRRPCGSRPTSSDLVGSTATLQAWLDRNDEG